jgi:hypothetical protein
VSVSDPVFQFDADHDAVFARCDEVHLGFEDHGIYTVHLGFTLGGGGLHHGTGHMMLSHRDRDSDEQVPTDWAMPFLLRVMQCLGNWNQIKGQECLVLYPKGKGMYSGEKIAGIAPLPSRRGRPFIFDEVLEPKVAA